MGLTYVYVRYGHHARAKPHFCIYFPAICCFNELKLFYISMQI